jgi:hypothetical protein
MIAYTKIAVRDRDGNEVVQFARVVIRNTRGSYTMSEQLRRARDAWYLELQKLHCKTIHFGSY